MFLWSLYTCVCISIAGDHSKWTIKFSTKIETKRIIVIICTSDVQTQMCIHFQALFSWRKLLLLIVPKAIPKPCTLFSCPLRLWYSSIVLQYWHLLLFPFLFPSLVQYLISRIDLCPTSDISSFCQIKYSYSLFLFAHLQRLERKPSMPNCTRKSSFAEWRIDINWQLSSWFQVYIYILLSLLLIR